MKYYTIQNNGLLIADNESALTKFYDNVFPLPQDYEAGKYIIEGDKLVINPDWEEEYTQHELKKQIEKIKQKLNENDLNTIRPLRAGETERLEELEELALKLREELRELTEKELKN